MEKAQLRREDASKGDLLTAKEVAALCRISVPTLYRQLSAGPTCRGKGEAIDLRDIRSLRIGGRRFWSRASALAVLAGE
jgi:hypothetical protein